VAIWAWAVWERIPDDESAGVGADLTPRWAGRLSMAAALSVPAVAVYVLAKPTGSERVDQFRLFTALFSLVPIALLVFAKQWLLNRELLKSLDHSRRSYDELGRMQEQLLQTEKMVSIGRLVAGAAHEINNPLTAIVGYSDLMANDQQVKPEHRDFANKILEQARQTKGLVQNLLAFAKSDTGRREPVDLNRVTATAIQLRKLDLQSPRLTIRENLANDLPPIMADATQLTHVLLQLISQMAALSGVDELRIRTWREEDQVFWSCTPAVPGRENVTPPEAKGVGVSVSHGIIRDHGGALRQNSRAYLVRLPATSQPATVSGD
jgi:two-component system, NtrC family, sensor kinase